MDYIICLNLESWLADGHDAYISANGVINIFERVPVWYFDMSSPRTQNTPSTPLAWLTWQDNRFAPPAPEDHNSDAESFEEYAADPDQFAEAFAQEWDEPNPAHDLDDDFNPARAVEPEPAAGDRDLEDHQPQLQDQLPYSGDYDVFGDPIPRLTLWEHLSDADKIILRNNNINTAEDWYTSRGSGLGALVLYLLIRSAKANLIFGDTA